MSRKHRFVLPGVPQHVVQRGPNRNPRFFPQADYQRCLHDFHEAAVKSRVQIHACVLMTNHVDLLLKPETPGQELVLGGESCKDECIGRRKLLFPRESTDRGREAEGCHDALV